MSWEDIVSLIDVLSRTVMGSTCLQLSNSPTPNLYQNTKFASLVIYVLDFDRFSLFPLYLKPTDFPQTLMIDLILTDDGF